MAKIRLDNLLEDAFNLKDLTSLDKKALDEKIKQLKEEEAREEANK